ncbi:MAG: DPP IV N-terminal domain-containing protein [Cyclobacteriaceae bacterium]|nr:DPP IV N-terminal domain-containing protein [Cyclobacteriaceae bacterium]
MKNLFSLLLILALTVSIAHAQDKLKSMPGYSQYQKVAPQIRSSVKPGSISAKWSDDGSSFEYVQDKKTYKYTVKTKKVTEVGPAPEVEPRSFNRPARGRQFDFANSPDGKWKAYTKDRNMYLSNADGSQETIITNDANAQNQIKYGIATWVYGEELGQTTAMWWSPDSKKIAFYKFVEKDVKKYYVLLNQLKLQDSLEIEAYPKVGADNLPVDLMVYDVDSKKVTPFEIREGKPFDDGALGTYVYGMSWTPDGKELLYHSTNRKQDIMELRAADPATGKSRTVVREEWLASFTKNTPEMQVLKDGKRFIWASERSGFNNYYLYDFSGKFINAITNHAFEVARIVKVDEKENMLYYMARSSNNHMKIQLHKIRLDGTKDVRLTNPAFDHSVTLSPDNKFFVDVAQTHDTAPFTNLIDAKGKVVAELVKSDLSKFEELGLKNVEVFTFTSVDGVTQLHGMIHYPSTFDPSKKYPVILSNYGGPATNAFRETFTLPDALTEYGFIILNIDGRNVGGRGKRLLDQLYGNLGKVEMDDFAAGVKSLYNRTYIDKTRVGVYGTSYGGTTAATLLLRYPDVFHVAVANSAVTDWRNYDNVYTERFMNLLENNLKGYEASSLMPMAKNLQGELLIFFGTADNNVHPANSLQLIDALQKAGKSIEVQLAPDGGHTALNRDRMMEFFIKHLVMKD